MSSNPAREQVESLLRDVGAVLVRKKKHEVWRLPNGRKFIRGTTPSDVSADTNNLSDLRNMLGLVDHSSKDTPRAAPRERKPGVSRPTQIRASGVNTALRDQLVVSGVVEESLREQNEKLQAQVKRASGYIRRLQRDQDRKRARVIRMVRCQCWWCKVKRNVSVVFGK